MTITQIITAIQKQLQSDFCTVADFIESQGVTCEIEIEHESNVHFYVEYQPSEKNIEWLQILKVSEWSVSANPPQKVWNPTNNFPAHQSFIQGAFPLLYAERFAEVCEIEAEEEAEADREALERAEAWEELQFRMSHQEY